MFYVPLAKTIPEYLFQSLRVSEPDCLQEATQYKTQDIVPQGQTAVYRHLNPYLETFPLLDEAACRNAILFTTQMTFSRITQNSLAPYIYSFSNTSFSNYDL